MELHLGVSRKIGQANYGSKGASAELVIPCDPGTVNTPDALVALARLNFLILNGLVDEELARQVQTPDANPRRSSDGPTPPRMEVFRHGQILIVNGTTPMMKVGFQRTARRFGNGRRKPTDCKSFSIWEKPYHSRADSLSGSAMMSIGSTTYLDLSWSWIQNNRREVMAADMSGASMR
jgi:hypothetical protein